MGASPKGYHTAPRLAGCSVRNSKGNIMTKTATPSQIRNMARVESKADLNQAQRLALVSLANNKENRAIAQSDVADVVSKTLAGHYQQKPEAAQLIIRAACLLEAAIFDPLFSEFNGHRDQIPGLFVALEDPYAAVSTAKAEKVAKLQSAGLSPSQIETIVGNDKALTKARTSTGSAKVRKACATFIAKYGQKSA